MGGMWVVLDTTVLRDANENLASPTWKAIRSARASLPYQIAIPEVVVRESSRQLRDYTRTLWNRGTDGLTKYASRVGVEVTEIMDPTRLEKDLEEQAKAYRADLESEHDRILALPKVTIEELLDRAVEHVKPFDQKGRGLRDYLIWKSILELRDETTARIIFVTKNSSDFATDGTLAKDLAKDLEALGAPTGAVTLVEDVEKFIDETLQPSLDATDTAMGRPFDDVYSEAAGRTAQRLLADTVARWSQWVELAEEATIGSDEELALEVNPVLPYAEHVGAVRRILALPAGEALVDVEASWVIVGTYDDRRRADDPLDEVEVEWKGRARIFMDGSSQPTDVTLLSVEAPEVASLSTEGRRELDWYNDAFTV